MTRTPPIRFVPRIDKDARVNQLASSLASADVDSVEGLLAAELIAVGRSAFGPIAALTLQRVVIEHLIPLRDGADPDGGDEQ